MVRNCDKNSDIIQPHIEQKALSSVHNIHIQHLNGRTFHTTHIKCQSWIPYISPACSFWMLLYTLTHVHCTIFDIVSARISCLCFWLCINPFGALIYIVCFYHFVAIETRTHTSSIGREKEKRSSDSTKQKRKQPRQQTWAIKHWELAQNDRIYIK